MTALKFGGDYPAEEDHDYIERVITRLALGAGVACFYASDPEAILPTHVVVTAAYDPGKAEAIDPDTETRVRELIRQQVGGRAVAHITHGFVPVVD